MKAAKISIIVILCAASALGLMRLRGRHANLRKELTELQRRSRGIEALREENQRLNALLNYNEHAATGAPSDVQQNLERSRRDLVEVEQRAARSARAYATAEADVASNNYDPEK